MTESLSDNLVISYFNRFKIIIILFYSNLLLGGIIIHISEIMMYICILSLFILIVLIWYHIWYCSKLVGKSSFLYLIVSIIFNVLGPVLVYYLLKKSISPQSDIDK
jgi:hypothetical protein